jgi:DNA-binding MarR family transcriptional regulator
MMAQMKPIRSRTKMVKQHQAVALHEGVDRIVRKFKLEPSMLVGSAYAELSANHMALLAVLARSGDWNIRRLTQALGVPFSTVSSALDRLEAGGLVKRRRRPGDRRAVYIESTAAGRRLGRRLRVRQIEACRAMLAKLYPADRQYFIRLVLEVAGDS